MASHNNILSLPLNQVCMIIDSSDGSNNDESLPNSNIVNLCNKIATKPDPFRLPSVDVLAHMPLSSLCLMVDTTGVQVDPNANMEDLTLPQICFLAKNS
jgi:hypothetical protein